MESSLLTRLKRVAGKQTVSLTHLGRKSGQPHQVTIWFVSHGDKVYLGTANVSRQWVRNVQRTPQVKLSISGETFQGSARFLAESAEHKRAQSLVARKYWMFGPFLLAGRILVATGLMRDKTGFFEVTLTE
jgi:deazaflavin-dependent oxidoreductase (nitroreductase family)